jgi:hypothetical protein
MVVINEMEKRKAVERNQQLALWKINKIDKPSARLTQENKKGKDEKS